LCFIFSHGSVGKGKNMSYLFWIILPLAIWLMAWIVIDFMISENKGQLEDVINCKWGKDTK
tara:strand:+ start:363 stop:545 length:183 start_codon:yes stop_codon:yes gene_type:complete